MIPEMILEMMLVLGDERTFRTRQQPFRLDVLSGVIPEIQFSHRRIVTLLAPVRFHFALRVYLRRRHARFLFVCPTQRFVFHGRVVGVLEMFAEFVRVISCEVALGTVDLIAVRH